jgi:hypothetical protein
MRQQTYERAGRRLVQPDLAGVLAAVPPSDLAVPDGLTSAANAFGTIREHGDNAGRTTPRPSPGLEYGRDSDTQAA